MPVNPTSPGVYIEEARTGVRAINSAPTSVAAFVGTFQMGPIDTACLITDFSMFEQMFGEPISETHDVIKQFFQSGGKTAYVVRVGGRSLMTAAAPLTDAFGKQLAKISAGQQVNNESVACPGAWGNNLRFEVFYTDSTSDTSFVLRVKRYETIDGKNRAIYKESHSDLRMKPGSKSDVISKINANSGVVQLAPKFVRPDVRDRPRVSGTLGGNLPDTVPALAKMAGLRVSLLFNDADADDIGPLELDFSGVKQPETHKAWAKLFRKRLRSAAQGLPEPLKPYLNGASVKLLGAGTDKNPYRFHVYCGRKGRPFLPQTELQFSSDNGNADALFGMAKSGSAPKEGSELLQQGPQQFVLSGGKDDFETEPATFIGDPALQTGIYALEAVETFNILCIPELSGFAADKARVAYSRALAYVTERRAMLIVDPPDGVETVAGIQDWMQNSTELQAPNAAVYFPRIRVSDEQGAVFDLANSGTIAGLMALTDETRGVWKAPAGVDANLRMIRGLTVDLTDSENDVLNTLGINALRNLAAYGPVCWGARTMAGGSQSASEWKYVPVRRTMLFIEQSLQLGTKWVVFEPNAEPLWSAIRRTVDVFMNQIYRQGALQGANPKEAYFVKCDRSTMTQADVDQGIINITVGFAPLKPAEFVVMRIRQVARPRD